MSLLVKREAGRLWKEGTKPTGIGNINTNTNSFKYKALASQQAALLAYSGIRIAGWSPPLCWLEPAIAIIKPLWAWNCRLKPSLPALPSSLHSAFACKSYALPAN